MLSYLGYLCVLLFFPTFVSPLDFFECVEHFKLLVALTGDMYCLGGH